jgi:hypothetical protein
VRIWYDTEFHNRGHLFPVEAISIGMVREDGEEYYAVFADGWDLEAAALNPWLAENVLPHLPPRKEWVPRERVAEEISLFIRDARRADGQTPQLWAYYAGYDHVVYQQLYGRMEELPQWLPMFSYDLIVECKRRAIRRSEYPPQPENQHDALADARWNRSLHAVIDAVSS